MAPNIEKQSIDLSLQADCGFPPKADQPRADKSHRWLQTSKSKALVYRYKQIVGFRQRRISLGLTSPTDGSITM
ncbi:MAG: hypothetical protein A2550_02030 [Candidatus Jacksonbacteria bacterium RIFOXYD2_FULL_43_21]|nr:MAG: hypothetical protein A2550_02030 [Candidatus Jacksonbacteria bacterium RIFOXYD2_FULL_43_21]